VPSRVDDPRKSVVLITEPEGKQFGTGFSIWCETDASWILTCAHVVSNMSKGVLVNHTVAEVLPSRDPTVPCRAAGSRNSDSTTPAKPDRG